MLFSGLPLLTWLVIAWAFFTTILILLVIYRAMVGMHREEQVFLTEASRGFESESAAASARLAKLRPYIRAATALSAVLAASIAAVFVTQTMQRF